MHFRTLEPFKGYPRTVGGLHFLNCQLISMGKIDCPVEIRWIDTKAPVRTPP